MRLAEASRSLNGLLHTLDFEWSGAVAQRRMDLLHDTIESALQRTKTASQRAELEYAHRDCHRVMEELEQSRTAEEEVTVGHRFRRLARVALYYESGLERLNRRYWWALCTLVLVGLVLSCHCCPVMDWASIEASSPLRP